MFPTSLPGGSPGGITSARPTSPRAASCARRGMRAASSGVSPPSASSATSAQPSGGWLTGQTGRGTARWARQGEALTYEGGAAFGWAVRANCNF